MSRFELMVFTTRRADQCSVVLCPYIFHRNNSKWFWPTPPPMPTCPGRITAVWCLEDSNGALQDIAYLNTDTGLQKLPCSNNGSTSDEYTKALFLAEHESIVSVRSCSLEQ